ncbi:MAG: hypothetical protein JWM26_553, partial [Betaproteobacteria bacterium]|nr:hypothetical protein [Betaproteobacteria bacterium]
MTRPTLTITTRLALLVALLATSLLLASFWGLHALQDANE